MVKIERFKKVGLILVKMASNSFIGYDTRQGSLRELVAAALSHIPEAGTIDGQVYLVHDSSVVELKDNKAGLVLSIGAALQLLHDNNLEATLLCLDSEGQKRLDEMIILRAESYGQIGETVLALWKNITPSIRNVPVYNYPKRIV